MNKDYMNKWYKEFKPHLDKYGLCLVSRTQKTYNCGQYISASCYLYIAYKKSMYKTVKGVRFQEKDWVDREHYYCSLNSFDNPRYAKRGSNLSATTKELLDTFIEKHLPEFERAYLKKKIKTRSKTRSQNEGNHI